MPEFKFKNLLIDGLKIIEPFYMADNRGYFLKSFEREVFAWHGIDFEVFEDFESLSVKGVLRGLHFQTAHPQAKLVRCVAGTVFDVAVDLRRGSPTFGRWHSEILCDDNNKIFYIPAGFAHGFYTMSKTALVNYKCQGKYSKETDAGIIWNDPDVGVEWPLDGEPLLSDRDRSFRGIKEFA